MANKRAGAVAKRFGLHPDTVRSWTTQFEEFFSYSAHAGAEMQIEFTHDDEIVINTICELRKTKIDFEQIRARLAAGERVTTLPPTTEPVPPETQLAVYNELRETKQQVAYLTEQLEAAQLQGQSKDEEIKRLIDERAAWRTRYEILQEQMTKRANDDK